jgi:hypothetical protein
MSQLKEYDDAIESSQWFSDSCYRLLEKENGAWIKALPFSIRHFIFMNRQTNSLPISIKHSY